MTNKLTGKTRLADFSAAPIEIVAFLTHPIAGLLYRYVSACSWISEGEHTCEMGPRFPVFRMGGGCRYLESTLSSRCVG